jgi:hypothetical protein
MATKKKNNTTGISEALAVQAQSIDQINKALGNIANDLGIITATDSQLGERLSNIKEIVFATAEAASQLRENHNNIKTGLDSIDTNLKNINNQLAKPNPFWQFMNNLATQYWKLAFHDTATRVIAISINSVVFGGLLIAILNVFGVDYNKGIEGMEKTTEAAGNVLKLGEKVLSKDTKKEDAK